MKGFTYSKSIPCMSEITSHRSDTEQNVQLDTTRLSSAYLGSRSKPLKSIPYTSGITSVDLTLNQMYNYVL